MRNILYNASLVLKMIKAIKTIKAREAKRNKNINVMRHPGSMLEPEIHKIVTIKSE